MAINPALLSSDLEHWLTPPDFLELVGRVLGAIDLDPATNRASLVPANSHAYVGERDGLTMPWVGRIFCNPPYGTKIPLWCERMHIVAKRLRSIDSMICLLPARVDTDWAQRFVLASANAWVLWSGRLTFWKAWDADKLRRVSGVDLPPGFRRTDAGLIVGPDLDKYGKPSPAPFPSLVPYWGPDPVAFGRVFQRHGMLVIPRGPKAGVYPRRAAA